MATTARYQPLYNEDAPVRPAIVAGIVSTWIATFLAAADSTVTSTLSATIASEFDSLAIISWLGSGYLIGLTAIQPLSGKLSDIFGRRASFCCASWMFTIGNLVCGLSCSKGVLIAARVVTGIGGGGCISIATFIASDNIPLKRRGIWQGTGAVVYTAGMGLGAVIGGAVNDAVGWRWAFIGIAPISLVAGLGVMMFVPGHTDKQSTRELLGRVDFAGALTLVSSLRTVVAACLTAWFVSMAFYALTFYVPLYMKMLGHSSSEIGLRLLPDSIGAGLGSFLVGLVIRVSGKYGVFRYTMTILLVLASVGFVFSSVHTPWILPELYLLCKGFGMGGVLTMLILALLHSVPHKRHATATSALYAFRSTGATVGLSAASAVFYHRMYQSSLEKGSSCKEGDQCYLDALHGAFQLALVFAAAGVVSALFVATHESSGREEDGKEGEETR
ncbi:Major facilitator superfamily domain general substrate transporter [Penicillium canariense]|uniref:MFS-type drug efflux transporter P55 n=1 Tax=Penicillium canariense TaxID=189055 RepID=A0A9W9LK59_9EURO|nr:Major facilitator superfamily domain general substrate transporter [Penicillium canariense]KAJ5160278.1 Major facilitator superfamily domain general substrate transporter [Penicillium canariense]